MHDDIARINKRRCKHGIISIIADYLAHCGIGVLETAGL